MRATDRAADHAIAGAASPGAARADASALHGALLALVLCQVGLHACTQGVRLAAPLQALNAGHGPGAVGLLMALFALLPAVLALPAGRMADRYGYHRPARIAGVLSLLGACTAALGGHYVALCVAAALCGAGSGFGMIAVQRTAGRMARSRAERLRIFSWVAMAPAVAGLLGPMLAGVLIDHMGFRSAFFALAALPAAMLLMAQAVPRETGRLDLAARAAAGTTGATGAPDATGAAAEVARPRPAWELLRAAPFRRLLFINWLVATSWDVFSFALPILGHDRGLSASAIGGVLAAYAAASMAVRLLIPLLAERLSQRWVMGGALLLVAAVFVAFPLLDGAAQMALAAAVLGLALGAVQPAILSSVHDVAPRDRQGEAQAVRAMTVHVSMAAMPLLFGALGTSLGAAPLFWLMALATGAGAVQARGVRPAPADPLFTQPETP
jgi:MFS family permease